MTREKVLDNLKALIGNVFDEDDIICAFGDFEEDGEKKVIVKDSENNGYDKIAYIDSVDSTQFLFSIYKNGEEEIISEVWIV